MSYVVELSNICEFDHGIIFQFTILHTNIECQMLCYDIL
jgi:hypothetical protein